MGRFVKLLAKEFNNASRDKRELSVVKELQQEIIVIARGNRTVEQCKDYTIHKLTVRPFGNFKLLRQLNRLFSIFIWALYVQRQKADYISCHDLIALFIGWVSTWGIKKKTYLIYDAHEFEMGSNNGGERGKIFTWVVPRLERFLIKRCAFSIMVNNSIADAVQQIYELDERPLVVRNIPPRWQRDDEACKRAREEICRVLNISMNTFIVMYHGGITYGRGIETLLEVVKADDNIVAVILGDGEENYVNMLKGRAMEFGINSRVLFHPAVPVSILKDYVGAADVGVTLAKNTCMNHYYMLPNKLFECIQSETPVIGSEFPEIKRIIDWHGVGLCCNPEKVESIVECIEKLRTDQELYKTIKNNLKSAKEELCWENERKVLEMAYRKLFTGEV